LHCIIVIVCNLWVEVNLCRFFIVCLFMYCCWRSSYQKGMVGIPLTSLTPLHSKSIQTVRPSIPITVWNLKWIGQGVLKLERDMWNKRMDRQSDILVDILIFFVLVAIFFPIWSKLKQTSLDYFLKLKLYSLFEKYFKNRILSCGFFCVSIISPEYLR
jgi:hypothetical protein